MGSRSRPLGTLGVGADDTTPSGGAGRSSGRLGGLGGGAGAPDAGAGPSAPAGLTPPSGGAAPRLTPAERFKPKPQPRSTRRASADPKPDPDAAPPSARATRGRGGGGGYGEETAPPPGRGGPGAGAHTIKPDPDAMAVDLPRAARPTRGVRAPAAPPASTPSSSSSGSEGEDVGTSPRILTASDRLRASALPAFSYAAKLARHAPPPVELAPPPVRPPASSPHFPVSAFGTGLDGGLTLLQLPARLPAAPGDRTPPPPRSAPDPDDGCASIADLPPGVIGKVLVLKSGAVKVHIGDVEFDLVPGMPVDALAAGVRLNLGKGGGGGGAAGAAGPSTSRGRSAAASSPSATAASIGQVINRATLVPDVGRLLRGEAAPEYTRAAGWLGPRALDARAAAGGPPGAGGRGAGRAVVASDDDEGDGAPVTRPSGRAAAVAMEESE